MNADDNSLGMHNCRMGRILRVKDNQVDILVLQIQYQGTVACCVSCWRDWQPSVSPPRSTRAISGKYQNPAKHDETVPFTVLICSTVQSSRRLSF